MAHSPAYDKFIRSTNLSYEDWHEGNPYDMDTFRALPPAERDAVVRHLGDLHSPNYDWRDIEVFEAANTPESIEILKQALTASKAETRLRAASTLHDMGLHPALTQTLIEELSHVEIYNGLTFAFGLLDDHYTPALKPVLLRAIESRPDVAVNLAAKLYQLVGKSDEEFDWSMRPLFLRLGAHNTDEERAAAFKEFSQLIDA